MSAAEQQNPRKPTPAKSPDAVFPPAGEGADLSFARLLEQLEAEADQPILGGDVSQIFAIPPKKPAQPQDAQPFTPSAFTPAQPAPDQSFAPQPAQLATSGPAASGTGAFTSHPANPIIPHAKAPEPSPTTQQLPSPAPVSQPPSSPAAPARGFAPSQSAASSQSAPATQPETGGEFTRIFTQLPTPRSAPPAILAEVAATAPLPLTAPASQPGEFTQFFQALDPAKSPAPPPVAADMAFLPTPQAPTAAPAAPPAPARAQQPAHPSPQTARPMQPAAQAFQPASIPPATQAFQPAPPTPLAQAFAPAASAPQPRAADFTAFFNSPSPSARETVNPLPAAPMLSPAPEPGFPAGFAEPPRSQPAAAGGFTELLRTLSTEGTPAPATTPAARPLFAQQPGSGPAPITPAPEQLSPQFAPLASPPPPDSQLRDFAFAPQPGPQPPAAGAQRPGEFTQLMQSLQPSNTNPTAVPAPSQTPFFDNTSPAYAQSESEYTRIIRTSAARSAEAPVPAFAPAPQAGSSRAAVGLPIAAPQLPTPVPPALSAAPGKTKLQAMMPLLLAANGALLLLLIVLALLFFRHHR